MTIFLSYSHGNESAIKVLARALEGARREVWLDHELDGGDKWWETILCNIRGCGVFVFALSDESLDSTACMAEFRYARALQRPILPVLVGHLSDGRANPLAEIHRVAFRTDDAIAGAAVLAAVDRAAARRVSLPDPLPPEPPIPLPYLDVIRRQVDASPLDPTTQAQIVDQLRRGLAEERQPELRAEIVSILYGLLAKPWRTPQTGFEIRAVLGALAEMEDEIARLKGTDTVQLRRLGHDGVPLHQPATQFDAGAAFLARYGIHDATTDPDPPPEEIFQRRMEEISRQMQSGAAVRVAAGEKPWVDYAPPANEPEPAEHPDSVAFAGVNTTPHSFFGAGGVPASADTVTGTTDGPEHEPIPATLSPLSRRAPAATGLVLAALCGVLAVVIGLFPLVVVVPFVVAAATAVVALRFSMQVGKRYRGGDADGARRASHVALVWSVVALTLIGTVVGLLVLLKLVPSA